MGNIKFHRFFLGSAIYILLLISCAFGTDDWPWDNPFGFCNPWSSTGQIGAVWCRCGGGSTHIGNWPGIQPNSADEFDWSNADSEYEHQHKPENLIPVPILCYTPKWAMSGPDNDLHYPQNPFDYYRFVNAVAKRYHGKIPAYEVWNEPNGRGGFFRGGCDALAKLIKLAFCAIKEVDPELKVIFPGLAGGDAPYTQRLYELGAQNSFDIMAFHPYQFSDTFSEGWQGEDYVRSIRGLMDQYGDSAKPIWLNEFGWSTDADTKARLLAVSMTFYHSLEYLGVEKMIWYNSKSWGDQFGLIDNAGKKTIAFDAYETVVTHLLGKHYTGHIPFAKARAFVFAANDVKLPASIVLWSPGLEAIDVQLQLSTKEPVKITQLDGTFTEVAPNHNGLAVTATAAPKFLTVPGNAVLDLEEAPEVPARPGLKIDPGLEWNVWAQVVVPEETHRAYIVRGDTEVTLELFNCSEQSKKGMIKVSSEPLKINTEKSDTVASLQSFFLSCFPYFTTSTPM